MITKENYILENLRKTHCYRCGGSLERAEIVPISNETSLAWVAHAVCPKCKAESMVTITPTGNGIVPVQSDLKGTEFKKFVGIKSVSYDEVLDLHLALKKEHIWNLLQKNEKKSAKPRKA
ncbi:MAG: hypothetical protein KatS3mg101_0041 [Patescibacteria group bacterium]|nr:MAG: hypothetical protein KatS3mg101_0041 [Patescibacteria group bacterium]